MLPGNRAAADGSAGDVEVHRQDDLFPGPDKLPGLRRTLAAAAAGCSLPGPPGSLSGRFVASRPSVPGCRVGLTGSVWTNDGEPRCNGRVSISVQDRKRLWGRAASRCAFPDCRQELIEEMTGDQGDVLVGQEAHIIGRNSDGPRGKSDLTAAQRDTYENLILLCARHHIIIDNDVKAYPLELLEAYAKPRLSSASSQVRRLRQGCFA